MGLITMPLIAIFDVTQRQMGDQGQGVLVPFKYRLGVEGLSSPLFHTSSKLTNLIRQPHGCSLSLTLARTLLPLWV